MIYKEHDYQRFSREFILDHDEAGLFLGMGMGKTVTTLTAIRQLSWDIEHVLIIAPKRTAIDTWPEELEKWDHLNGMDYAVAVGSAKQRDAALKQQAFITIINRENVVWLVDRFKRARWPYDCIVIDELSSFKSSSSKRFRALKRIRPFVKRVIGLTGTPSANGYMDLWAEAYMLDCGKALGPTLTGYRNQYFTPGRRNGMVIYDWDLRPGAKEEILSRLSPICVSMKSEDYLDLKEMHTIVQTVSLTDKTMKRYQQMERDMLLEVDGETIDAVNAAALTTKLLQISSGAVYDENGHPAVVHEEKLEALDEIIESAGEDNILVFYAYRHELDRLKQRYPQAVDIKEKDAISRWKAGKIRILLAHPASAGHGLNLQSGGHISVWYSLTTSLELYQQACKRLHRQGQTKPVINYVLLSRGTYDEVVYYQILQRKEKDQNGVLAALKARLQSYER